MARFDVFANPEPEERAVTPFLVDVQNDYIDGLSTRMVVPLRTEAAFGRTARGLNPMFIVADCSVVMDTAAMGAITASLLRKPLQNLRAHSGDINAALNTLFGPY